MGSSHVLMDNTPKIGDNDFKAHYLRVQLFLTEYFCLEMYIDIAYTFVNKSLFIYVEANKKSVISEA